MTAFSKRPLSASAMRNSFNEVYYGIPRWYLLCMCIDRGGDALGWHHAPAEEEIKCECYVIHKEFNMTVAPTKIRN